MAFFNNSLGDKYIPQSGIQQIQEGEARRAAAEQQYGLPSSGVSNAPSPETPASPSALPEPVTTPETPSNLPGPSSDPQGGQTGRPAPPRPPSPGPVGQGQGLAASEATGGLEGTFRQAGTAGFGSRFGSTSPASWFRNMAREGGPMPGGVGNSRAATTRGGATSGGSSLQSLMTGGGEAGAGGEGMAPDDAEWQRFMQAVLAQRFGQ